MPERRPASHLEAKALSHPLRVRLLTMLSTEELTTSELARRCGENPGTILYHLRVLVDAGLAETSALRIGARNSRELPYRSTGKANTMTFRDQLDAGSSVGEAIMQGALSSYYRAEPSDRFGEAVARIHLTPARLEELQQRLRAVIGEFRNDEGEAVTMLVAFHHDGQQT